MSVDTRIVQLERESQALYALIANKWMVGEDPSGFFKRFIVINFWVSWPDCVVADGDTEVEAIEAAVLKVVKQCTKVLQ